VIDWARAWFDDWVLESADEVKITVKAYCHLTGSVPKSCWV